MNSSALCCAALLLAPQAHVKRVGQKVLLPRSVKRLAAAGAAVSLAGMFFNSVQSSSLSAWTLLEIAPWLVSLAIRATIVCILRHLLPFKSKKDAVWSGTLITPYFVFLSALATFPWLASTRIATALLNVLPFVPSNSGLGTAFSLTLVIRLLSGAAIKQYAVSTLVLALWETAVYSQRAGLAVVVLAGLLELWHRFSHSKRVTAVVNAYATLLSKPVLLFTAVIGVPARIVTRVASWKAVQWARRQFGRAPRAAPIPGAVVVLPLAPGAIPVPVDGAGDKAAPDVGEGKVDCDDGLPE